MKKLMNWVLAATLVCDASMFTSCTEGSDNPAPENAKDRKEFIAHTRQNLKYLAENLNFTSWEVANTINQDFNMAVLNNPEFEKTIIPLFTQKVQENIQPVEEGSELAEMGYKQYATIDLTKFNYRFTMKEDGSGFDVEEADGFEMIINATNPRTQQWESGMRKLTLQASGDTYKQLAKRLGNEDLAVVFLIPSDFVFTIEGKATGDWLELFKGEFTNYVRKDGTSEFINAKTDETKISGHLKSTLNGLDGKEVADATDLYFTIGSDPVANESSMKFSFGHNDKSIVDLDCVAKYTDKQVDFSQFTTSSSIIDVLVALMSGSDIKATFTLNDDLTTTLAVNDCGKVMQLQNEMAHARRNYADQATIDGFTKQLNGLVKGVMSSKGVTQEIPMNLATTKIGVDWWAVPALKFADEQGYVPLTDMLDKESIEYGFNIIDHAAEPMAGSIITVRQLLQFVQTILTQMRTNQAQAANE